LQLKKISKLLIGYTSFFNVLNILFHLIFPLFLSYERYLIVVHESNKLEIKNEKIFINGIETSTYLIKENYYFVLDDNRDNAKDSRYWGFLPESHIIGKATFLWFSYDKNKGKIRWNRIFKTLKNEV